MVGVSEDWNLDDPSKHLGTSAKNLRRWQAFKRYVLELGCVEINDLTGISLAWETLPHDQ